MNDQIQLAGAMGMTVAPITLEDVGGPFLVTTAPAQTTSDQLAAEWIEFNPFTDANDDYAVLEWMREKTPSIGTHIKWASDDEGWVFFNELHLHKVDYKIGDYARAALKALERVQTRRAQKE